MVKLIQIEEKKMIPISLDKFCKKYIQINKGENLENLKERLKNAVKRKKEGEKQQLRG